MADDGDKSTDGAGLALSDAEKARRAKLSPAAQRALAEADERRRLADAAEPQPKEIGGRRKGLEPVRYGDWEKKGIAVDF
ncbi:DUF1674 domain-containing protein [Rhodobium orientis]|uniref:DUF1674 domain-containing protein n=1 Tax=Rhodobium orientis TaxID=34017 RepID=A0A327JT28_9HYPH|nr:DUF1674 domain-containing protein [Rhodobium orientis]MBK5948238.1 DUF1674 domain-containing protein [Rhodobium orientis]RAI28775.1 DUF1674 domain-containing protein [Rhodobium orientis]